MRSHVSLLRHQPATHRTVRYKRSPNTHKTKTVTTTRTFPSPPDPLTPQCPPSAHTAIAAFHTRNASILRSILGVRDTMFLRRSTIRQQVRQYYRNASSLVKKVVSSADRMKMGRPDIFDRPCLRIIGQLRCAADLG